MCRALSIESNSYMFASISPGLTEAPAGLPVDLGELLQLANGFNLGSVAIFSNESLPDNQFYLENPEAAELIANTRQRWICFGTHVNFPLLMNRENGEVWWFKDLGQEHFFLSTRFERLVGDIDELVEQYLLNDGYLNLVGAEDWWYNFLRRHEYFLEG